jgi:hypothetical protein
MALFSISAQSVSIVVGAKMTPFLPSDLFREQTNVYSLQVGVYVLVLLFQLNYNIWTFQDLQRSGTFNRNCLTVRLEESSFAGHKVG